MLQAMPINCFLISSLQYVHRSVNIRILDKKLFIPVPPPKHSVCVYLNINQPDALNFIMSLFHASTVSSKSAYRQEAKIVLYSLWYHHTYRWPSRARDGHLQLL